MLRRFVRVKIRNVLSLFDGMRCGAIALERADIGYDKYFASEIDKYAIKIADKNYPKAINLGDINDFQFWEFIEGFSWEDIDLVMGGSPCQDLSIAKHNRKGLEGERSGLFWRFVEILEKVKPKYFLLENVASMRNEDRDTISSILGVEPILINSALLSAQQRKRYYWTNIWTTQPNDCKIFLKDIIETEINISDNLSSQYSFDGVRGLSNKARSMGALYKGVRSMTMTNVAIPCAMRTRNGFGKQLEIKRDGKANSITTVNTDSMLCAPIKIGNVNGSSSQGNRVYSVIGKSVSLNANGGAWVLKQGFTK